MFQNGRSVSDIAKERGITENTVEGHLARFIASGEVGLEQLVPNEKIEPIREAIVKFADANTLSPIKEFLGDEYRYGEIKAVIAAMGGEF
jgi:ATP-dependent DNA helicase RecQ